MFRQETGIYGIIRVNPERHPHVKTEQTQAFIDQIFSNAGQQVIASYPVAGEQFFFPNAE